MSDKYSQKFLEKKERRWALWFGLVVLIITTLPYIYAYVNEDQNWVFSGFVFGIEDGNSYIAKMLSGNAGAWLFRSPFSSVNQKGIIAFLPYLVLGKLGAEPALRLQLVSLFHIFRFVAGILMFLAVYDFLALFLQSYKLRRLGVAISTLGGGFGWLLVITDNAHWLGSLPLEFYSPETFGFLSLYGLPHLAMGRALLLWGMVRFLRVENIPEATNWKLSDFFWPVDREGIFVGLMFIGLGLMQPLTVVVAWLIIGCYLFFLGFKYTRLLHDVEKESLGLYIRVYTRRAVWGWVISAPLIIYVFLSFQLDPFLRSWTSQNLILSPHPVHYIVAYGLLVPFFVMGGYRLLSSDVYHSWLPVIWGGLVPALVYLPYNLQRRLPEGGWVAISLVALYAFENIDRGLGKSFARQRISSRWLTVFILVFPSTIIVFTTGIFAAQVKNSPVFIPRKDVEVYNYLEEIAKPNDVVLSSYDSGNVIPTFAPVRVVVGHGPESVQLDETLPLVENFYKTGTKDAERIDLLETYRVKFVIWGANERRYGEWDPGKANFLKLVKVFGETSIFFTDLAEP